MNDFLRNLRTSHKKDKSDHRRNLDGHYYPKEDRRQRTDRRFQSSGGNETLNNALQDALPRIADSSSEISMALDKFLAQNEKLVEAKIQQLNSVSSFFENLNKILTEDLLAHPQDNVFKTTSSYAVGTHYTKDEILNIIRAMRKKGATFALIAEYLRDKGIPTFSGRGEWHAQTIHRLCK